MKKQTPLKIPADHPTFAGHFPDTPIVPGVVLLNEVMHAIASDTSLTETSWQIISVKFLSPLKPDETVVIKYERLANDTLKFEVLEKSRQIVIGSLITKQVISAS